MIAQSQAKTIHAPILGLTATSKLAITSTTPISNIKLCPLTGERFAIHGAAAPQQIQNVKFDTPAWQAWRSPKCSNNSEHRCHNGPKSSSLLERALAPGGPRHW